MIKKEDPPEGTDRRGDLTRTRNLELPSEINLANRLNPVKDFYFLGFNPRPRAGGDNHPNVVSTGVFRKILDK